MRNVPGWPSDSTALNPTAIVKVDGVEREAAQVSFDADLSGAMPAPVVGGSGITAATGSVDWASGGSASRTPPVPWLRQAGWPPVANSRIEISAGYGDKLARLLTGKISGTNGTLSGDTESSSYEDDISNLNQPVTIEPLLDAMPSETEGVYPRYIGLVTTYVVDRVLRSCGFNATPRRSGGSIMSAPLQGSMWPERGKLVSSVNIDTALAYPRWSKTPWGVGVTGVNATYTPQFYPGENGYLDKPMEVTLCLPSDTSGTCYVAVMWQGQVGVRLNISGTLVLGQVLNPSATTVCQASRSGARTVTLRVEKEGTNLRMEVRTNNGASASGVTPIPDGTWFRPVQEIRVYGAGLFGGVQVAFPSTAYSLLGQVATAKIDVAAANRNAISALPAIVRRPGLEVLKEIAAAECAEMWIDGDGVFQWVDRTAMIARPTATTLTALDNLIDANWVDNAEIVRRDVTVAWKEPEVTRAWRPTITVFEGSGDTLQNNEPHKDTIQPDSDEVWVMVDSNVKKLWQADVSGFNKGVGSWTGGILINDTYTQEVTSSQLGVSMKETDPGVFTVTHTPAGIPAGDEIQLRATNNPASALWATRLGANLPVVRCSGRAVLTDKTTVSAIAGPVNAEPYTHDTGYWIQDSARAQELADYLGSSMAAPMPLLTDAEIVPDPRIERGDIVWVEDPLGSRIRVKGIVSNVSLDISEGDMSMSLSLRTLTAQTMGVTLGERDMVWSGSALSAFDAYWATKTLAQYDADPLSK